MMTTEVRTRTHRISVRLSDDEYDYFEYLVGLTGLTREAYLRKLISGKVPKAKETTQAEQNILAQLSAIGNNLNQIARQANSMNIINVEKYNQTVKSFEEIMRNFLARCDDGYD